MVNHIVICGLSSGGMELSDSVVGFMCTIYDGRERISKNLGKLESKWRKYNISLDVSLKI